MTEKKPPEDAADGLRQAGKRLAYLLHSAPLTDDAKADIIQTVPFMTFEQIDELMQLLEEAVKTSTGDPKKDELFARLNKITDAYEAKRAALQREATAKLDDIEKELADAQ